MTTTDLWPDIKIEPKPRGVRQMLEEAGQGLKEKTHGWVEFQVWPVEGQKPGLPFRYRCELHVRNLDYSYRLLEVDSAPTGFPVQVRSGLASNDVAEASDEASLRAALASVFQSEQTKAVIENLISMATDDTFLP
jgi:hypothetical protein